MGAKSGVLPGNVTGAAARRGGERARWVIGSLLAAAVLVFCYLRVAGTTQVNSDGAGLVWQAWDMLHGNVLLHGWWATDVSFYTTELPAFAAMLACYALTLGVAAAHRQAPPRNVALTGWLLRHHLTSGFAPYWEASSITVNSGGAITVLAVTGGGWHGHLEPQRWETNVRLAESGRLRQADFVILSPAEKLRHAAILATFGRPAGSYGVGPYTVLVWRGDLAPKLTPQGGPPAAKTVSVTRSGG